jgi:hypothetical protein
LFIIRARKMQSKVADRVLLNPRPSSLELKNRASRAPQCRAVLDTFGQRMERIVSRPITLHEFCDFMGLYDTMLAAREQFVGEAGVVDEMFGMMREYHM